LHTLVPMAARDRIRFPNLPPDEGSGVQAG
jgi:hypothetical protein